MRKTAMSGFMVGMMVLIAACSSAPTHTVSAFQDPPYRGPAFNRILIVGIAENYNNRAAYERELAGAIRARGATATPSYTLMAMDAAIDRELVAKLVEEGDFDSVLVTRPLRRGTGAEIRAGQTSTKVVRMDGEDRVPNLFRYEYKDIEEPDAAALEYNVVIGGGLFSAATQERIWNIEVDIADEASVDAVIIDAADAISAQLSKDGLIRR